MNFFGVLQYRQTPEPLSGSWAAARYQWCAPVGDWSQAQYGGFGGRGVCFGGAMVVTSTSQFAAHGAGGANELYRPGAS